MKLLQQRLLYRFEWTRWLCGALNKTSGQVGLCNLLNTPSVTPAQFESGFWCVEQVYCATASHEKVLGLYRLEPHAVACRDWNSASSLAVRLVSFTSSGSCL